MAVSSILAVGFVMKFVAAIFIILSLALILIVLVQKGKGGGLSATFGGTGGGGLLGSKTGDFLTWVTISLAVCLLFILVLLAKFYKPSVSEYDAAPVTQQQPMGTPQQAPPLAAPQEESPMSQEQPIQQDANQL